MKIPHYLAMTAQQFQKCPLPQGPYAWMSCHFSLWGKDLSNIPTTLPPDSLLILDDQTPPEGQDPETVGNILADCIRKLDCHGLLLDFQRPGNSVTKQIVYSLIDALSCPVCVSDVYAQDHNCPVFLPPVPLNRSLQDHLAPWSGREIWLETDSDSLCFTVTKDGCHVTGYDGSGPFPHRDPALHTRYRIETAKENAAFYLHRSREDQQELLKEAIVLGVTGTVEVYHAK